MITLKPFTLLTLLLLVASPIISKAGELENFFIKSDQLFKQHVKSGKVNYAALKANPTLLNELYDMAGRIKPNKSDENTYKAFWINTYNLCVIKSITDSYPINSPMEIHGFFDRKEHFLAGRNITLNYLENKLLRAKFNEPRLHFVLVCGAISCPQIVNYAYLPQKLNSQMDIQTREALNDPNFLRVNHPQEKVLFSEIFKWYESDFTKNGQSLVAYVNKYRNEQIPANYKFDYYTYDWSLNDGDGSVAVSTLKFGTVAKEPTEKERPSLQTFTPGTLLRKGQMDFTLFNTIYTETKSNWKGTTSDGFRTTFATSQLQWTYGISKNARFNIGGDIYFRGSGRASADNSFGAIDRAFNFKNTDSTRGGIAALGLRVKISPFQGNNDFSIQSTFLISPVNNPEGQNPTAPQRFWLEWDRFIWWNQFFYTRSFGSEDQFQLFAEADLLFRFKRRDYQTSHLDLPSSIFLSYFPTNKITFYIMSQYVPRLVYDVPDVDQNGQDVRTDWVIGANYTASGAGFKYQFTPNLNVELLYTNFWRARNNGLGETFNLGIKYLTP